MESSNDNSKQETYIKFSKIAELAYHISLVLYQLQQNRHEDKKLESMKNKLQQEVDNHTKFYNFRLDLSKYQFPNTAMSLPELREDLFLSIKKYNYRSIIEEDKCAQQVLDSINDARKRKLNFRTTYSRH